MDTWEYKHFKHLIDLKHIFLTKYNNLYKNNPINIDNENFTEIFNNFIYQCSSGKITNFLNDMSEYDNDEYIKYIIKRNEF